MIIEVASVRVHPGEGPAFERAFAEAQVALPLVPGYRAHELLRPLRSQDRYVIIVRWVSEEAHSHAFRDSPEYRHWRDLLSPFEAAPPDITDHVSIVEGSLEREYSY